MKFGAVPDYLLSTINLSLPPEPAFNATVLSGKRVAQPKVYVGAATWGGASWPGKLYLPKTPATKYRQQYPLHFNAIEFNATHYNIYSADVMRQWAAAAKGRDFKYCPKFPQQISHHSNFINSEILTDAFIESIAAFEENLGPAFLQVSEFYAPAKKDVLYQYQASLPRDMQFFLEVRHPDWFADMKQSEELFETLKALNVGAVITDAPGRRDIVHMHVTVPKLFLRFVCNSKHATTFSRIDDWVQRMKCWIDNGLEEAYVFMHPGDDSAIPDLAAYWINELNAACNLQLKLPMPVQQGLF